MTNVNDILLTIKAENSDVEGKLSEVSTSIKGLGKVSRDTEVGTNVLSKGLNSLKLAAKAFLALEIVQMIYNIGKTALGGAADLEKNRIAFEKLTGSAAAGKKILDAITKYSAETPFELPGLIEVGKQLIAFGVNSEDVIDVMKRLGDAAMGDQAIMDRLSLAYGKVAAKGRASMEELNMFTEAGVPILQELAKQYNVSTSQMFKLIENGKVGFKEVDKALSGLTTGAGKFAGMTARMGTSLGGVWSTFKDNFGMALTKMGDMLAPWAKWVLQTLNAYVLEPMTKILDRLSRNEAKIAGTKNALTKILADISKYEQAYKIQQERVNTVGTDEQINKLREYRQILVGLYQLRDKAKNEISELEGSASVTGTPKAPVFSNVAESGTKKEIKSSIYGEYIQQLKKDTEDAAKAGDILKIAEQFKKLDQASYESAESLAKFKASIIDTYTTTKTQEYYLSALDSSFKSFGQASNELVYDMLWGKNGWKNFGKQMSQIFKQLIADLLYATIKAIALQAILSTVGTGGGGFISKALSRILQSGHVPSFSAGYIPSFANGYIPSGEKLAYINYDEEAVLNARATRANADILRWMNDHPGEKYSGSDVTIHNNLTLDGQTVFENQEKYRRKMDSLSGTKSRFRESVY